MNKTAKFFLCTLLATNILLLSACGSADAGDTLSTPTESGTASTTSQTSSNTSSNTSSTLSEEQIKMQQYLPSSWQNQIETVKKMGEGKFVFGVQTDTHHYDVTSEPTHMRNLAAATHFAKYNFIAVLGDLVRGYSVLDIDDPNNMRDCMDDLVDRYTLANSPVLITIGNHDANHMWTDKHMPGDHTTLISEVEHFQRVIAPIKEHNGDNMVLNGASNYYFMDFPEDNIRVVMLNTTDGKFTESMSDTSMISDEQLNWLKNTALDTDKFVIVMSHIPFYWPDDQSGAGSASITNGDAVVQAVEDFIDNGGNFVGYFHGHMHERCINIDENGRFHMGFIQGGNPGETVIVDVKNRVVETIIMGNGQTRQVRF